MLHGRFDPILSRGTTLPASSIGRYSTTHHQQTRVEIQIYEGEHREAEQNDRIGVVAIEGLAPLPDPHSTQTIEVRFTHDVSGLLEIDVVLPGTEVRERAVLNRGGVRASEAEQEARLADLAPLKVHPRELLPNRWVYERANRVLTWLAGDRRAGLDRLLDRFEVAMHRGDLDVITACRAQVRSEVARIEAELDLRLDP